MEQTRSLTADRDSSWASMVTLSRVRPIWSRNETVCTEPLELVSDGALKLPLESRAESPVLGLEHGEGSTPAETVAGNTDFWAEGGELFADICLPLSYKNSCQCLLNGSEDVFKVTGVKKKKKMTVLLDLEASRLSSPAGPLMPLMANSVTAS